MPRPVTPLKAEQRDYLQLAKQLFLEALRIEPHCPYNNARCAKGLWSMPVPYKDKECAKQAILHALTMAPDDSLVRKVIIKQIFHIVLFQQLYGSLLQQVLYILSVVGCSDIYHFSFL